MEQQSTRDGELMQQPRLETDQTGASLAVPSASTISLTIVNAGDNQSFELPAVPLDTTPAAILEQLVSEGCLPQLPGGRVYQLSVRGDILLDESWSLGASGVRTAATLCVTASTLGAANAEAPAAPVDRAPIEQPTAAESAGPVWLRDLASLHAARAAHFFVLYLNTDDYVYDGTHAPRRVLSYLAHDLKQRGYCRLALVNLSEGLTWLEPDPGLGANTGAVADKPPSATLHALTDVLAEHADATTAVLIEHLEHLVPADRSTGDRETLKAAEILITLAQDETLRASGCLIIALCRAPETIAPGVLEATGGAVALRIPLPTADDRRRFLEYLASSVPAVRLAPLEGGLSLDGLAHLTAGVTLAGLDVLNRQVRVANVALTYDHVRACKKTAIEQQSRGLLEALDPRYGFNAIGGLAHVIAYLRKAVGDLREGRGHACPKGVLLAGPPGTGKTLVAEALAKEAGFNLVRMGDARSKWVGESEQNMSLVLRLLAELAPVVVFVDEVDQMVGARDQGRNGDSGVSARLFARLLNFMGRDEHRGRIIWVAATNRPDLLDDAMLRRFDRVFPFVRPGAAERRRIFAAMPVLTDAVYAPDLRLDDVVDVTDGLPGSAIEQIVRRAMELTAGAPLTDDSLRQAAGDYKPNHDPRQYHRQELLAINATNLFSSLPPSDDLPQDLAELVHEMRVEGSAAAVHGQLRELETATGETHGR